MKGMMTDDRRRRASVNYYGTTTRSSNVDEKGRTLILPKLTDPTRQHHHGRQEICLNHYES